jgi:hypothetical protein
VSEKIDALRRALTPRSADGLAREGDDAAREARTEYVPETCGAGRDGEDCTCEPEGPSDTELMIDPLLAEEEAERRRDLARVSAPARPDISGIRACIAAGIPGSWGKVLAALCDSAEQLEAWLAEHKRAQRLRDIRSTWEA